MGQMVLVGGLATALHWLEAASLGRGHILEARWAGVGQLQVRMAFASDWPRNPQVTLALLPRQSPLQWLLSVWRQQKETLIFEADLDYVPDFLEVYRRHWSSHPPRRGPSKEKPWTAIHLDPVMLTTRSHWEQQPVPVVTTLMTSREHNLIGVRLQPQPPQLTAAIALDDLSGQEATASFLNVIHDLAVGASPRR